MRKKEFKCKSNPLSLNHAATTFTMITIQILSYINHYLDLDKIDSETIMNVFKIPTINTF